MFITDYDIMESIIKAVKEEGFKVKSSVILDRGDWPAMTVEITSKDTYPLLVAFLETVIGVTPIAPVRRLKRKDGTKAIKFSLKFLDKEDL